MSAKAAHTELATANVHTMVMTREALGEMDLLCGIRYLTLIFFVTSLITPMLNVQSFSKFGVHFFTYEELCSTVNAFVIANFVTEHARVDAHKYLSTHVWVSHHL